MDADLKHLIRVARDMRLDVIAMSQAHQNGHVAPALSCIEILAFLYESHLQPEDRFILAKGHGCLSLYAALRRQGLDPEIAGHPDRDPARGIACTSGSLGHGLGIGAGQALAKRIRGEKGRVFILMGDGECQEGSVWESFNIIRKCRLNNLVTIIDHNGLQALGAVRDIMAEDQLGAKFEAFGGEVHSADGHDFKQLAGAFEKAGQAQRPAVILARTVKGKGISFMENVPRWHTRLMTPAEL
ncbi:MAG: transketolase, partial [Desulfobacterales bacterium]|nr:transketolase [Desulfobacterales bacterium]